MGRGGALRLRYADFTGPKVSALTDGEFRAFFVLAACVARFGNDGEFPLSWVRFASIRVTPRRLGRFIELGLIEEHASFEDGREALKIVGWRGWQPVDATSAERKRRLRQRLYGSRYRDGGEAGKVSEIHLGDEPS